jgi:uroporphyrinogen decarboxylase
MTIIPCRAKWAGRMSDRERFVRQMHFQAVDRCFNMEFGYWDENFQLWPMFADNGIRDNHDADIYFNFDRIECIGGNVWVSPGFGNTVVEERETTKVIMNEDGVLAEVPTDGHDTIPHYIQPSVATPEDWRRVKEERFRRDDPRRRVDVAALMKMHPPERLSAGGGLAR